MKGVFSYLPVQMPSIEEVETCQWIELPSAEEWNPKSDDLEERERLHQDNQVSSIPTKSKASYSMITISSQLSSYYVQPAELSCSISFAQSSP